MIPNRKVSGSSYLETNIHNDEQGKCCMHAIHTRPELQLSTSKKSGAGDEANRPLMHQPVNYPDVRIVHEHKLAKISEKETVEVIKDIMVNEINQ